MVKRSHILSTIVTNGQMWSEMGIRWSEMGMIGQKWAMVVIQGHAWSDRGLYMHTNDLVWSFNITNGLMGSNII